MSWFCFSNEFRWEVIVRLIDIGEIIAYHCYKFKCLISSLKSNTPKIDYKTTTNNCFMPNKNINAGIVNTLEILILIV